MVPSVALAKRNKNWRDAVIAEGMEGEVISKLTTMTLVRQVVELI